MGIGEPRTRASVSTICKSLHRHQYSRDLLLKPIPAEKNFYLVECIRGLGERLRFELGIGVTLHWIPLHIEHTVAGWRPIHGNRKADKLVEQARDSSRLEHTQRQTAISRTRTSVLIVRFLQNMERIFKTSQDNKVML